MVVDVRQDPVQHCNQEFSEPYITGVALSASAPDRRRAWASIAYAACLVTCLLTSASYHTINWKDVRARAWMRRADHAAIYVLIAGTYTPICLIALRGSIGPQLLVLVWAGAGVGIAQALFWTSSPKAVHTLLYLLLGWIGVHFSTAVVDSLGLGGALLIVAGGILYSVGAMAYVLKWPDPAPRVFGYHEIFHVFVLAASALHFTAVSLLVHSVKFL